MIKYREAAAVQNLLRKYLIIYPVLFLICVRHITGPVKLAKTFTARFCSPFFMNTGLYSADHLHLTEGSRREAVVLSQAHWATSQHNHMPEEIVLKGNFFKDSLALLLLYAERLVFLDFFPPL